MGRISEQPEILTTAAGTATPRWSWLAYAVLAGMALLWTAGLLAAPAAHAAGMDAWAMLGRLFYSPVCHQDPARSFLFWDWPLSACHRCSGIYAGFTLTVLLFPLLRRHGMFASFSFRRLVIFLFPLLLDYALDVAGVWNNSGASRSMTGLAAGAGLALFTVPAWMEAWSYRRCGSSNQS